MCSFSHLDFSTLVKGESSMGAEPPPLTVPALVQGREHPLKNSTMVAYLHVKNKLEQDLYIEEYAFSIWADKCILAQYEVAHL
jgi:hypothetical protein